MKRADPPCLATSSLGLPCGREADHPNPEGKVTYSFKTNPLHMAFSDSGAVVQIWRDGVES